LKNSVNWRTFKGDVDGDWDELLLSSDCPAFFQSTSWARYKNGSGWNSERFIALGAQGVIAATQVLIRSVGPALIAWAPGGITFFRNQQKDCSDETILREARNFFLKQFKFGLIRFNFQQSSVELEKIIGMHFNRPFRKLTSRVTSVVDCLDYSISKVTQHHRRRIKKSTAVNIVWNLSRATKDLYDYSRMVEETARRNKIQLPFSNLTDLSALIDSYPYEELCLLVGCVNGQCIAGVLTLISGDKAFFLSSASSKSGLRLSAAYSMINELLPLLRNRHVTHFDFGGLPDPPEMKIGIVRFKLGFGGAVYTKIGEFEVTSVPPLRWLYNSMILLLGLLSLARSMSQQIIRFKD
jgi:lipid II:glycine glycyltransferase (peptidoglycan interpeptide bridge formation enzyme)